MGLLDSLMGNASGLFGQNTSGKRGFLKTLRQSDFATTGTLLITTDFTKVGEYTVPAQQEINVGFGNASQPDNQGYIYVNSVTAGATACNGLFKITISDANQQRTEVQFSERTDVLAGSVTLRTQKVPFPELVNHPILGRRPREDDRIALWLQGDTAITFSPTASTIYIPVTVYQ